MANQKEVNFETLGFIYDFLEYLANYICYAKKETKEQRKQRKFEEENISLIETINNPGETLREDYEAQAVRDYIVIQREKENINGDNYYKRIKQKIDDPDIEKSKLIKEYSDFNKKLKEYKENNNLSRKEKYKIQNIMNDIKDDMIRIKNIENGTINFNKINTSNNFDEGLKIEIDFNNLDDYKTLFMIIPFFDYSDNLKKIGNIFKEIENNMNLTDNQEKLLNVYKKGKPDKEKHLFYVGTNNRRETTSEIRKGVYWNVSEVGRVLDWDRGKTWNVFDGLSRKIQKTYKNLNKKGKIST
jgi:hypothetical protein